MMKVVIDVSLLFLCTVPHSLFYLSTIVSKLNILQFIKYRLVILILTLPFIKTAIDPGRVQNNSETRDQLCWGDQIALALQWIK